MTRPGSRSATRSFRAVLVIGAVLGGVALGGCGAGQIAQTAYQKNNGGGADVGATGLLIRGAEISFGDSPRGAAVHPAGSDAPVSMTVINQTALDDRLVSASSPVAASVRISGQSDLPAGVAMVVGGGSETGGQTDPGLAEPTAKPPLAASQLPVPSEATAAPRSAANEPSDSSPTGSASPSGEAPAAGLRTAPPISTVDPSTRYADVVLTGLREDIRAGLAYEIDLTFEKAGVVRVMLPVAYPAQPRPEPEKAG